MIKKRYILIPLVVLIIGVIVIGSLGYILFLRNTNSTEVVFAATEVGTPAGDKVTKDIGPAGGTLASADGRLTLTVPEHALTETVKFGIQPVTNKFGGGLGNAYRLEPSGKTFTTPLKIAVHYDDQDLEGTVPEALSMAYQDEKGSWRVQKTARLDQAAKTISVATTHFSDWSFLARLKLSPSRIYLKVGQSQVIALVLCEEPGFINKFLNRPARCDSFPSFGGSQWKLSGPGTLSESGTVRTYTAPGTMPSPNEATVVFSYEVVMWNEESASVSTINGSFEAKIWIKGPGYRATGSVGDTVFSGIVCDPKYPFTVGTDNAFLSDVVFSPSSETRGSWKFVNTNGVVGGGGGEYTVTGTDTLKTGIEMKGDSSAYGTGYGRRTPTLSGGGDIHLTLTPLTGDECGGGQ